MDATNPLSQAKVWPAAAAVQPAVHHGEDLPSSRNHSAQHATSVAWLIEAAAFTCATLLAAAALQRDLNLWVADGLASHAAEALVPCLFILSRVCFWGAEDAQSRAALAHNSSVQLPRADVPNFVEFLLPPVQQWLQASGTQEQLVAAGYTPQAQPQQLQQAVAAMQAVRDSAVNMQVEASSVVEAAQSLQAAGNALCSFAVPCLCNNPSCFNLSRLTELGLVSGRSCVCGGCRVARCCGRACQRAVWKQHKPVCTALAAAAAAAAAAAGAGAAGAGAGAAVTATGQPAAAAAAASTATL